MTEEEKQAYKAYVAAWKRVGEVFQAERDAELRSTNTITAIQSMEPFYREAMKHHQPEPYSGLVEQQRWFMKLHRQMLAKTASPAE